MPIQSFEDSGKYFIKFFLLDATLNLNKWGVTEPSLLANLDTFLGKPFVITPNFGHPNAASGDELLKVQDNYKVGTIIEVGLDKYEKKAFGIAEIKDPTAIDLLRNGKVNFVSPSIVFNGMDVQDQWDGSTIVNKFEGAHVAGVKDPAYGMYKAQIKGKCAGDKASCTQELAMVQASKKGKILTFHTEARTMMLIASQCVEDCIQAKRDAGKEIDDQALAICYSECGESRGANIHTPDKECGAPPKIPCLDEESASIKSEKLKDQVMTTIQQAEMTEEEKKKKYEEEMKAKNSAKESAESVEALKAEVEKLRKDAELSKKSPLVKQIVDAKTKMNLGNAADIDDFGKKIIELPEAVLSAMSIDYESMASKTSSPKYPYEVRYASTEQKKALDIDNFRDGMQ